MRTHPLLILCVSALLAATGCHRNEVPAALDPGQAAPAVQAAFQGASPDVKGLAGTLADSLRDKDYPKALENLDGIDGRKDLTVDQRQASARARMTVMQQLAAAAAAGDASAADTLKAYRATK